MNPLKKIEHTCIYIYTYYNTKNKLNICKSTPNPPVNITNNNVDKYSSMCNINIRSVRNKLHFLQNFADEYDILCVTESHLDVNINNDDLSLDFFSKTFIRNDRNNSGGGLLIYFKDDIFHAGYSDTWNRVEH
jgi:hypothetical protein